MKNKGRKHGCRFDPDEIMLMVLIFVLLGFGILALTEIGSLVWDAITNIRVTDPAQEETAEGETLSAEAPAEGIGRRPAVTRYLGAPEAAEIDTAERERIETYTEGEGPAPEWYDPDEPMAAEWEEPKSADLVLTPEEEPEVVTRDIGCPDWNIDTTLWGWDGHGAEAWELELFARVFYLEFWGTSRECSEAGCDAILNMWASGIYGRTLFEVLSYYDPEYGYTFRVYPHVWETVYDADGLAWCRAFCESRFYNGPEWSAMYFQLGGYHDPNWVPPLYEIDGVYFSGARG